MTVPGWAAAREAWPEARSLGVRAVREYLDDHGPQFAAAIAYYVLFSLFPLAILFVAVAGLVLRDSEVQEAVVDTILRYVPLSSDGQGELEQLLEAVAQGSPAVGLLGIAGLVWSASGMMGAIRVVLSLAWDAEPRPFLRGKLIDVAMLAGAGVLVLASLGLTVAVRVVAEVSGAVADALALPGPASSAGELVLGFFAPFVLTFLTFVLAYRLLPSASTTVRQIWPGALFGAVAFEAAKHLFAVYLENFGRYEAVYGSLGAIVAFLFFVFIAANVLILGAEVAAIRSRRPA